MSSYNYSYNVLINRFEAFAAGHLLIKRFSHGQIDLADMNQDEEYPFMHVTPDTIEPVKGGMQFGFHIIFADIPRDKEVKPEYQREVISDCVRLGQDLIAEIQNGLELFGFNVQLINNPVFEPFMEEYKNTLTGVAFTVKLEVPWDWSACDIPAVWSVGGTSTGGSGTPIGILLQVNNVDNAVQSQLDLVAGDNVTLTDNGDGSVTIDAVGGGGSGTVTSVGLTAPAAFNVSGSPVTTSGTLALTAAGNGTQYIDGSGALQTFPTIPAAQVNSDWNAVSGVAEILNKPTLAAVATSGDYNDLSNLPTIPAAQVNSDWNAVGGVAEILNKPTLPPVVGDMLKSVYDTDADGVVDAAETVQITVRNSTGATLTKGQVVYLSGATGNRPNAILADASTETTSSKTIGFVVDDITNNSDGQVAVNGTLHDLDTSAFSAGDTLWLSETAGAWQANTPPAEPAHAVFLGYVARSHPNLGRVVLAIQNGYELNELHGVLVPTPANNDVLYYDSATSLWKNKGLTKSDVGLGNVDNTSDANKPISTATQTALNAKLDANTAITGATKTKITYDADGLVTAGADIVASDVSNSTTVGQNLMTLSNPSAIRYVRINADNTVSAISLATIKSELGLGTAVLGSNLSNVGTTFEDITGMSFAVTANKTYKWRATLSYAVTGGAAITLSCNGPTTSINNYRFTTTFNVTTNAVTNQAAYDSGTNAVVSNNGISTSDGIVRVTAGGTFTLRMRCATAGALTIRAGSIIEFEEVL